MTAAPSDREAGPGHAPAGFGRFLLGDPAFLLGLGVWLVGVVPPLLPWVSGDLASYLSTFVSELPILGALLVVALASGRANENPAERRFRWSSAPTCSTWDSTSA